MRLPKWAGKKEEPAGTRELGMRGSGGSFGWDMKTDHEANK
jgi:hypothetical protein